jgi:tRNA(Ile)-lysidine synthase
MLPVTNLLNYVKKNHLFNPGDRLLAAVSGGRDSVLLVHLLKQAGIGFGIAHCNFQLRTEEADAEQQFTKNLANTLGAPFYTHNFDTKSYAREQGISTQMAARDLRYAWFEELRAGFNYDYIAVAHHQNDSIETILLNLTRGTGIAGMHGILPKNGLIVRPMLFLSREEVDDIVDQEHIAYLDDSSNSTSKYARNKIRLEVIPKLKELNPKLEETFEKNIAHFMDLEQLLQSQLEKLKQNLFSNEGEDIHISIIGLKNLHPKQLLLFGLFNAYGFTGENINDLISAFDKHSGRRFESPGYLLVLDRDRLILTKRNREVIKSVLIKENDHEVEYAGYTLNVLHDDSPLIVSGNPLAVSVDATGLIFPLTLRSWAEGDHFYPLGMGGRKKLSDFFVNQKVPLHQKQQIPVLVNGNGDIIWLGGYRLDERYKVSEHTKKVIIFELYKLHI